MRYMSTSRLGCFSPPVMIATFFIEIILAIIVLWRYKLTPVTRIAVPILVLLAVFQIAEYNVCEGSYGLDSLTWSRIGFAVITFLPPLGLHLATKLAGEKRTLWLAGAYVTGALFATFFLLSGHGVTSQACMGNYVIFQILPETAYLYTLYYYGWMALAMVYCFRAANRMKKPQLARALRVLAIGYLALFIPTTLANIIDPATISAIPSVMCGFAIIMAVLIAGDVVPQYHAAHRAKTKAKTSKAKTKRRG